jgi:acetyl esterase
MNLIEPALSPEMQAAIARLKAEDRAVRPAGKLDLAATRQVDEARRRWFNAEPPELAEVTDLGVDGPHGAIRVRRYAPPAAGDGPGILYFHGGGWFMCSVDTHDRIMRLLARASGCVVYGVDYRLAPDVRFPAPVDEGEAVWRSLGKSVQAVAGCSAGAHVALSLALRHRRTLKAMSLFYAPLSPAAQTASMAAWGDGRFDLGRAEMDFCWDMYLGRERKRATEADLLAQDVTGLPPTFIGVAQCDPLRDDSLALAAKLVAAGVPHAAVVYPGMAHSFLGYARMLPMAEAALAEAGRFIRRKLAWAQ